MCCTLDAVVDASIVCVVTDGIPAHAERRHHVAGHPGADRGSGPGEQRETCLSGSATGQDTTRQRHSARLPRGPQKHEQIWWVTVSS